MGVRDMALSKKQRAVLREKWGGKCAYCGCELGDKWHADHIEPVDREIAWTREGPKQTGKLIKPERDCIENMNPACPPCNIDKHSMSLEHWRLLMQRTNEVLMRDYPTFRRAVRYGLVSLSAAPIVFYFERAAQAAKQGEQS